MCLHVYIKYVQGKNYVDDDNKNDEKLYGQIINLPLPFSSESLLYLSKY